MDPYIFHLNYFMIRCNGSFYFVLHDKRKVYCLAGLFKVEKVLSIEGKIAVTLLKF